VIVRSYSPVILMLLVAGCAAPKPILYPNAHLQQVGEEMADRDIDECCEIAKEAGATTNQGKSRQVAGNTAGGGAIGSAAGAVGGAVVGHPGRGAMVGAAVERPQGFCADSFADRPPAVPISRLLSAVSRNGATIRWDGSESRIRCGQRSTRSEAGKVNPDERSCHIGDDVKE
jgi:hypothetical protein